MQKILNNQYMQYGCGYLSSPAGWINFDASPTLHLQRLPLLGALARRYVKPRFPDNVIIGDVLRKLPIEYGSCIGIYCSHVLEHLSLEDFRVAIKNTYLYLAPNGFFRMVMPDLNFYVQQYITSNDPSASHNFLIGTMLGLKKRERSLSRFLRNYIGNSNHLWMWDFKSAKIELEAVGFKEIRIAQFGDSGDRKFIEVEDESRWINCLGIECKR